MWGFGSGLGLGLRVWDLGLRFSEFRYLCCKGLNAFSWDFAVLQEGFTWLCRFVSGFYNGWIVGGSSMPKRFTGFPTV